MRRSIFARVKFLSRLFCGAHHTFLSERTPS
jgi:hypothetical protein